MFFFFVFCFFFKKKQQQQQPDVTRLDELYGGISSFRPLKQLVTSWLAKESFGNNSLLSQLPAKFNDIVNQFGQHIMVCTVIADEEGFCFVFALF